MKAAEVVSAEDMTNLNIEAYFFDLTENIVTHVEMFWRIFICQARYHRSERQSSWAVMLKRSILQSCLTPQPSREETMCAAAAIFMYQLYPLIILLSG